MKPVTIALAEDQKSYAELICHRMKKFPAVNLLFTAANGREFIKKIKTGPVPDIALLDIRMPGMDGIETCLFLSNHYPQIKSIAFTLHDNEQLIGEMLEVGAAGFVYKNEQPEKLCECILKVFSGTFSAAHDIFAKEVINTLSNEKAHYKNIKLTHREIEVLRLIYKGHTSYEIAYTLGLTKFTVDGYRKSLFKKTGTCSMIGLLKFVLVEKLFGLK